MIFSVGGIFNSADGEVVLGGTSAALDQYDAKRLCDYIVGPVILKTPTGELINAKVKSVESRCSLSGRKNIFLLIPGLLNKNIPVGTIIYKT